VGCEIGIGVRKNQIEEKERSRSKWVMERDCDYARVDSDAKTRTLLLKLDNLQLDYLKAVQNVGRAGSRAQSRYHEAMRLLDEQTESEQMAINVAAARNDPNFRIFKNDAILTADRTFQEALQAAYKATKVYDYYTSQSYAHLIDLFLVRMVSHGDISLEAYLSGLEAAFIGFEEQYGNPDLRVEKICLRDDILDTPFLDENHQPYALGDRTQMMRDALNNPERLDENGYIVVPFATRLEDLCPITHNHKIHYIEAQLFGSDLGDPVARIYLRQRGTGTVRGVDGQADFYAFPERTAVINPFVGDSRAFGGGSFQDEVFINRRLRDQPLVNSNWELLINMKDEPANRDLHLDSLNDICLYVYYTDFTEL
jgi:hypothetical protein